VTNTNPATPNDLGGENFQGLALRFRGRTGLSQQELAMRVGMHPHSIQGWESGANYPSARSLQALTAAYLDAGGFIVGQETVEAAALWASALQQAARLRAPFDPAWFSVLLAQSRALQARGARTRSAQRQDWGEAPAVVEFYGRTNDLEMLKRWILADRCQLVSLLGLGGIGKTMLAARLAQDLAPDFERVFWRSLRNAPPPGEWLAAAIGFLSDHPAPPPDGETAGLELLLDLLRERRCLLVLDNFETVLQSGEPEGRYVEGCANYGALLTRVAEGRHQSCLLLTSREAPLELGPLEGAQAPVRSVTLAGLATDEARGILRHRGLSGDEAAWDALVERYGGNSLALRIAGEGIRHLFGGNIATFLKQGEATFGGVRGLLEGQLARLSDLERTALRWLAVGRESMSFAELASDVGAAVHGAVLMEATAALRRRSLLVERRVQGPALSLHSGVQEYVTDRLIEDVTHEIELGQPDLLLSQALMKATSMDYVRRIQERLIVTPVLQRLIGRLGSEQEVERALTALLGRLRTRPLVEQRYGPGNLVNLLRVLRGHLRGVDLSGLELRQVFLRDIEAHDAKLTGSHLSQSMLAESFDFPVPVALSADGAHLAAGTASGEVRLWRVSDRTPVMSMPGQNDAVMSVALSGDGRLLASGSLDGTVKLLDAASGRVRASLPGHRGGVWGVSLSRDNRLLASGGQDGTVKLWDVTIGQLVVTLAGQSSGIMAVALSGDGRLVVSGGQDGTVRLWEVATGQLVLTLEGHIGGVMAVALSADGRLVASGGADRTARLWAAPGGEHLATLSGHADQVWGVALSADGRLLASSSLDGSVKLWSLEGARSGEQTRLGMTESDGGSLMTTLVGHSGVVMGVALSEDGRLVASGGHDGTVRLWEVPSGRLLASLQGRADQVYGAALSGDGQLLASGGADGAIRLWESATGQLLATMVGHHGTVWGVALSGDGRTVASGGNDGIVRLWESASGRLLFALRGHSGAVWGVALSADGQLLASGGGDGTVRLWKPGSGQPVRTLSGHSGGVSGVALNADAQLLASSGYDASVKLWQPATGELLLTLLGHTGAVWSVALSGDGRLVASGGADCTVRLWEAASGRLIATLAGHSSLVRAVTLSADGRMVAGGSIEGTLSVWDVENARLVATLEGHGGLIRALALSRDGLLLASGSTDGTLRTWDLGSGIALRTLRSDRRYERMEITALTGVTQPQRDAMLALGAVE
jgi:WD40 repeat protein/transcriptional regulator with XRE-family HTH domain